VVRTVGPTTENTETPFTTTGDVFRVSYEVAFKDPGALHHAGIDIETRAGGIVKYANLDKDETDSYIVTKGAGSYNLVVSIGPPNGATYKVTVEDCTGSETTTPTPTASPSPTTSPSPSPSPNASPTPSPSANEQQGGCRVVDTFTGSGETRTDTPLFTIVGPQWRVVYQTVNTAPPSIGRGGIFGFFIRNERGDALDPNGVEVRGDNSGIKNVNSDPGQYYIQIISAEVNWTIRVEDCAGSRGGGSGGGGGGPIDNPKGVVPGTGSSKQLPGTGGVPLLGIAAGALAFMGVSFSVLGILVRRKP
jgi:hypothetical protein